VLGHICRPKRLCSPIKSAKICHADSGFVLGIADEICFGGAARNTGRAPWDDGRGGFPADRGVLFERNPFFGTDPREHRSLQNRRCP
jgi:hypothetical protein